MLTDPFTVTGRVADRLLSTLPRLFVVPRAAHRTTVLQLLEAEVLREEPGQQAILDRLLDLVLAGALRDWFALPDREAHVSRATLARRFTALLGETPMSYLNQLAVVHGRRAA
ncbi:hypothetical protein GCM10023169_34020 [Georgenia halophila]|uniref:AraC-type transcription regulator ligand-binding domain-containing protein n=1 Tax=Georgenia halophila TaxID=620889 RepID=A0ABP8LJM2_9MICO